MSSATHQSTWDTRIARARELAASHPAARDLLAFYAALAEYQRGLAAAHSGRPFDVERVVEAIPGFLAWLRRAGKDDLAASVDIDDVATALRAKSTDGRSAANPAEQLVIESLLQAFGEQLVVDDPSPRPGSTPMCCPRCAGPPAIGVLREESHGARRSLLCAFCLREWPCLRLVCPACGEQDFDKLPVYAAEQFAHVRIDACDRCHHYIKTIDLTKDGLAVPCVDDIASVSLDLWALERGYTRIKRNVLGI
jgi:FdhE protein